MQIHELNTYDGTPDDSTYLALDDGSETSKVPATDIYPAMTQSQIMSGVNTVKRVLTAAVLKPAIIAVAKTITDKWVDMTTPKINLDTSAASGDDYDLTQALTSLGWLSDVVTSGVLGMKKLLHKMLTSMGKDRSDEVTGIGSFWTGTSTRLIVLGNVVVFSFRGFIPLADYAQNNLYILCTIPSGLRPNEPAPLFGRMTNGTYAYKGGVAGAVNTDGTVKFSCETHTDNYMGVFAIWLRS